MSDEYLSEEPVHEPKTLNNSESERAWRRGAREAFAQTHNPTMRVLTSLVSL